MLAEHFGTLFVIESLPFSIQQQQSPLFCLCDMFPWKDFDINRKSNRQTRLLTGANQDIEPKYCDIHQYPLKSTHENNKPQYHQRLTIKPNLTLILMWPVSET